MKKYFVNLLWDKGFENIFVTFLNGGLVLFAVLFGFWLYDSGNISSRLDPITGGFFAFFGIGFLGIVVLFVLRIIFRKSKPEE